MHYFGSASDKLTKHPEQSTKYKERLPHLETSSLKKLKYFEVHLNSQRLYLQPKTAT